MRFALPLIGMLLLTGCVTTVSSAEAVCSIPTPSFTEVELGSLSDQTLLSVDLFFQRYKEACD